MIRTHTLSGRTNGALNVKLISSGLAVTTLSAACALAFAQDTADRCDTSAFTLPAQFTFGSALRNSVIGPGYANLDLGVAKTWALSEPVRLEFRWETFNVFNRTNFDLPNRTFIQYLCKLRPDLQCEESARDAIRLALEFLSPTLLAF